jgi:hypothetical protein
MSAASRQLTATAAAAAATANTATTAAAVDAALQYTAPQVYRSGQR